MSRILLPLAAAVALGLALPAAAAPKLVLNRGVPGARCGAKAGVFVCKLGSSRSGRRSTVFLIADGRVDTVSVARAP